MDGFSRLGTRTRVFDLAAVVRRRERFATGEFGYDVVGGSREWDEEDLYFRVETGEGEERSAALAVVASSVTNDETLRI